MRKTNVQRLRNQNRKMSHQIKGLKKNLDMVMENSMSGLVQQAFLQTNLTSWNPILQNNIYAPLTINWTLLTYMYKTHGIIQTAIDMPVLDALRGGIELSSDQLSVDELGDIEDFLVEGKILEALAESTIWKRLYGGAALIINSNQDPTSPLKLKGLTKLELYSCNRWELMATWKPNEGSVELNPWLQAAAQQAEEIYFYGERIHRSRVLTMNGKEAPYIIRWQLQGWGMSEVERMIEDFNSYIKTKNVIYDLLEVAKTDIFRFEGFKNQLASAVGTQKTKERVELMNEMRNFNNALVMDKLDEYEQKQITFSGLAEVMKENRIGIASALRMPISKIFGIASSGFSSGEDDIENYNAMVESEVRQPLRSIIRQILNLVCLVKFGEEVDINFEYKPLRVLSSLDEETIKTQKSNRIMQMYDRALLDSKEVGEIMQKDKLVSVETCAAEGLLDDHPNPQADNPMGFPYDKNGNGNGFDKNGKSKKEPQEKEEAE